jgi:membrane protease YdiL (CAAX protease family)
VVGISGSDSTLKRDTPDAGRPRWAEVVAVAVTGVLHLVCKPLGLQGAYIVAAASAWIGFIVVTARLRPEVVRDWGFRRDNVAPAMRASTAVFVPVAVLMVAIAWARGTLEIRPSLPLMLLLYPAWGLVQQFLVQALLVNNLAKGPLRNRESWLIGAGGVLFSLVHVGNGLLMLATALVGAVFVWLYLRYRNLWPLGLFHGWLASLFYPWILERDKLTEIFGALLAAW